MAARQLSDGNTEGNVLGQSTSDLIGFWGKTPVDAMTAQTLATAATIATIRTAVQTLIASLKENGLMKAS